MKQYVIIGNGVAAVRCVEGIRSVDQEGSITVLSAEKHPAYCRPLISYFLQDRTDEKRMAFRPDTFCQDMNCDVRLGAKAVALDTVNKQVKLEDGSSVPYDSVCVAAGSSPFVPLMTGLDQVKECYGFLTLDDAIALKSAAAGKKVLILGAGLIGLKCAEGLHEMAGEIVICDLADRILSSILDAEGAGIVQRHLQKHGMKFILSDSVDHFDGQTAVMKSGCTVDFDVLVTAVGVRANTALVKDAGGDVGRGITVDETMKTTLPDVYAAGDCTQSVDITDGKVKVMALMPNANLQGYTAGVNMAGGDSRFDNAIPMNAIGFFGLHVMTAGVRGGKLVDELTEASMKRLYTEGDRMIGFEIIGDVKNTGIYTSMIRKKTDLSQLDVENMKKTPDLSVFNQNTRKQMLGGVV